MSEMLPQNKPQLQKEEAVKLLSSFGDLSLFPVKLLGIRGYFKKTMGNPDSNDIDVYDDAVFIIGPDYFSSFNFNTDPTRNKPGVATLKPGGPYLYKRGLHGQHHLNPQGNSYDKSILNQLLSTKRDVPGCLCYWALRQYGNVTVIRDGREETDNPQNRIFIDIHRGGNTITSSEGCQTVPPVQWVDFFWNQVTVLMEKNNQEVIPYCLLEN